ncbi:S1C family serine protease [Corynebacterium freneyi]|uniref:S1-C subfamily serine protease n=1 Tax=Corynebacterium freneyi TaxID=134034 RepID=A0ABS4U950_9CORY|nr:trypsin-like peptidase domain-containing protein [Corynebacterium freneyi]MBP2332994.1 S1-C subfamily serine protease [Corynebacterium freneyi]WJZ04904.1 Periplasmic serine endoprotease DegP precursor [Corynebacterium freneyi]
MTGRDPFARPDGVVGGVDPRHRGEEFGGDDAEGWGTGGRSAEGWGTGGRDAGGDDADLDAYVSREDLAFSPGGATHQGLQLPPNVDGRGSSSRKGGGGGLFDEPRDDAGDGYSPWANPRTRMVTGGTARKPKRPKREPVVPVPRVDVREAMFGRIVPWRFLALGAAVVLALGGIGGFAGGWAGKTFRADHERVELRQVEGRPGNGDLTEIGDVARRVQPAVASISIDAAGMSGIGSGVVIDDAGHILTNNHVVSEAADAEDVELAVTFTDAGNPRSVPATIVGRDPRTDLAVIKVEDVSGLTVAELGDSSQVRVGDTVIAMGSPQGLNGTVTSGIVSALNRPVKLAGEGTDTDGVADAIQTDASINPGNSGGPLVDVRGAVIGINTVIYSVSGGSQGLGFAIPINMAKDIAEQLIAGEQPVHPDIGIAARTAANGAVTGAEVATVVPDGPADAAGIREGDVITAVGERSVGSADELTVAIWGVPVGETVRVTLVRDGQTMELDVTPAG